MEDDNVRKKPVHEIGVALDSLSIEELTSRIGILKEEIERLERAIGEKNASRSAADAIFKL